MSGFTKLFSSIITSSIWSEDDKTRIMWITMLASADACGHVSGSIPGMAAIARMSVEDAKKSIQALCKPDQYSRSKEYEGRRLIDSEGGWDIVNYDKYRQKRDPEKRKEQNRQAQEEFRHKQKVSQSKPEVSQDKPRSAQAEAEAEAEAENKPPITPPLEKTCVGDDPGSQNKAQSRKIAFDYDTGQFVSITQERMNAWIEAYPAVDIVLELRRAALWLQDNPTKRKKNYARFLTNWLSRTQERGGSKGQATTTKREPVRGDSDWLPTEAEGEQILRECGVIT